MDECPEPSDFVWEEGRIFVIGRQDHAESLEAVEVFREGQRDSRTAPGIGGVSNCVLLQIRHVGQARILDAPQLFGVFIRFRHQRGRRINLPSVYAIGRTGCTKMRETSSVFDTAKQQGRSILEQRCACIENAVDRVWPVSARQDRVRGMAMKQRFVMILTCVHWISDGLRKLLKPEPTSTSCLVIGMSASSRRRISKSAIRNESVDSAP